VKVSRNRFKQTGAECCPEQAAVTFRCEQSLAQKFIPLPLPISFILLKVTAAVFYPLKLLEVTLLISCGKLRKTILYDSGFDILEYMWLLLSQCGSVKSDILFNGKVLY